MLLPADFRLISWPPLRNSLLDSREDKLKKKLCGRRHSVKLVKEVLNEISVCKNTFLKLINLPFLEATV